MSIRARLLWLVAVASLLPALLFGFRFLLDRESRFNDAKQRLANSASLLAEALDERILTTGQLLFALGQGRSTRFGDRASCSAFLARVLQQYPQFTGIITIDPRGQLRCDSLQSGRDLDVSDRAYFQRALTTTDPLVLEPVFGRLTGRAVLQIAYPMRAEGTELEFIMLASLELGSFLAGEAERLPDGTELALLDQAGRILAWAPVAGSAGLIGQPVANADLGRFALGAVSGATTEIRAEDGRTVVWATATAPTTARSGIHVLVGQARIDLFGPLNRRLRQDLIILAMISLGLGTTIWLVGEMALRRQVGRVAAMARRLGEGDLAARIAPPHPSGELGGLIAVLNDSAESLQNQRAAIDDLNAKLMRSQRMEAVGQLTGGLAHDFNNLLTVILGSAELLAERLQHDPEGLELATSTRLAAERGGELTRSLLAFARRQPLEPRRTDVGQKIEGVETLIRRTLGEHIGYRFDTAQQLWPALVDPAQLESALFNLVLNARDAMPRGGTLTVETAAATLDATYARENEDVIIGDYVTIAVTDTGIGMPPEVLAQAFEPFFTTKEFGRGSGLGLSMVYGFAKQSHGHVKIYSEPGHGTTVKLYLPRAPGSAPATADPPVVASIPGGYEAVLVVEDNDMVRDHVVMELRQLGYQVTSAANGQQALELLRADGRVDVLFTDVVMPGGMSGPKLAAAARDLRPGLRVLYTSGYTENAVVHDGRLDPGVVLLSKPYRRQELAEKLRFVLL